MQLIGENSPMVNDWSSVLKYDPENQDQDAVLLKESFCSASDNCKDDIQTSALLVSPYTGVLLRGWAGVPRPLQDVGYPKTQYDKKYCTEHAEMMALYSALENGIPTVGLQIYGNWIGCSDCARAIIRFGISKIVTFRSLVEMTPIHWRDSIWQGLSMMRDSGIQVVGWRGEIITDKSIRFDGKILHGKDMA